VLRIFFGSTGLRVAGVVLGLLVSVQLARGLGATGYGVYALALSLVSLLSIPAESGLPKLVTQEVAIAQLYEDWPRTRAVLRWAARTALALAVGVILLAGLACWLFREQWSPEVLPVVLIGSLLVLAVPFGDICAATLRGLQQVVRAQLPDLVLRPALFLVLLLAASLLHPGGITPGLAMAMQVLAACLAVVFAAVLLHGFLPAANAPEAGVGHEQERAWFRGAWPMAWTESMRVLHGNVLILYLGLLAAPDSAGLFRVASSVALLLMLPVIVVHALSAPVIARLHASQQRDALRRHLRLGTLTTVCGLLLLAFPLIVYGRDWLAGLFGAEFGASWPALLILGIGMLCGAAFGPTAALLETTGHERRVTGSFGLSLALLAVSGPPLILLLGAEGAALANSVAFVAWSAIMWRDVRRLLDVDPSLAAWRHLPASHAIGPA